MKVVLQRVKQASVTVEGQVVGAIEAGICLLVGLNRFDTIEEVNTMVKKVLKLRVFGDEKGMWKQCVMDNPSFSVLAVSQFTLCAKIDKGSKPDFHEAMKGEEALPMFNTFVELLRKELASPDRVQTGAFGQLMSVNIVNDGPVTIVLDVPPKNGKEPEQQ